VGCGTTTDDEEELPPRKKRRKMTTGEIQIMKIRTIQRLKGGRNLNVRKKAGRARVVRQNQKVECKTRKEEVMIKERNRGMSMCIWVNVFLSVFPYLDLSSVTINYILLCSTGALLQMHQFVNFFVIYGILRLISVFE